MPPSGISAENEQVGNHDVGLQDQEKKKDAESDANVDGISCVLSCQDLAELIITQPLVLLPSVGTLVKLSGLSTGTASAVFSAAGGGCAALFAATGHRGANLMFSTQD